MKLTLQEIMSKDFINRISPHYLVDKPLEEWDGYDWSNLRGLVNKFVGVY